MPKKSLCLISALLCAFLAPQVAFSHPPSQVQATFDLESHILEISAIHAVPDPKGDHYISTIQVFRNDEEIILQKMASQLSSREQKAQYLIIDARKGDTLKIYALCNKFGDRSLTLKVGE